MPQLRFGRLKGGENGRKGIGRGELDLTAGEDVIFGCPGGGRGKIEVQDKVAFSVECGVDVGR